MSCGFWTSQLQEWLFLHVVLFTANDLRSLAHVFTVLSCQHTAHNFELYLPESWQNLDKQKSQFEIPDEVAVELLIDFCRTSHSVVERNVPTCLPAGELDFEYVITTTWWTNVDELCWDRKISWNQVFFMLKPCRWGEEGMSMELNILPDICRQLQLCWQYVHFLHNPENRDSRLLLTVSNYFPVDMVSYGRQLQFVASL